MVNNRLPNHERIELLVFLLKSNQTSSKSNSNGEYDILGNNQTNARALIGQSAMVYGLNHSPAARDIQILLVFYQHPAWFISFY